MTTNTLHPLAAEYLHRLRRAGRRLPAERLRELLVEIEGHLSEAIEPDASDAQALTVLDKLGEPEEIVAAEMPDADEPPARRGVWEWVAIILLLVGGFIFGIGWIAGLIPLWNSRAWTTRDKLIGTLVIPGGLAPALLLGLTVFDHPARMLCRGVIGGAQRCATVAGQTTTPTVLGVAAFALLVLAPIATSVHLLRRSA